MPFYAVKKHACLAQDKAFELDTAFAPAGEIWLCMKSTGLHSSADWLVV